MRPDFAGRGLANLAPTVLHLLAPWAPAVDLPPLATSVLPESLTRGQPIAQLQGAALRCFAPQMKPQTRAPRSATPLILTPLMALLGAFCGLEFTPATLVWVVPGIAVLAGVIALAPYIRERMRNAQGT